jgi:hypothetical protein
VSELIHEVLCNVVCLTIQNETKAIGVVDLVVEASPPGVGELQFVGFQSKLLGDVCRSNRPRFPSLVPLLSGRFSLASL